MKSPQEFLNRSHWNVSTLLSVIGEDATKAFDAFEWGEDEDETKIEHVLKKFDEYCGLRTQVIYERYRFNSHKQELGESIAAYLTELKIIPWTSNTKKKAVQCSLQTPRASHIGLQARTPSMTPVKCAPYEKVIMNLDFLYRPNDCKGSTELQAMTKTCSNSLVQYTTSSRCVEKTTPQSLYLTTTAEAS